MATIVFQGPGGVVQEEVDAEKISDSGRVHGVRIRREDGSYLHVPYNRLYSIEVSEEEGQVDYSPQ